MSMQSRSSIERHRVQEVKAKPVRQYTVQRPYAGPLRDPCREARRAHRSRSTVHTTSDERRLSEKTVRSAEAASQRCCSETIESASVRAATLQACQSKLSNAPISFGSLVFASLWRCCGLQGVKTQCEECRAKIPRLFLGVVLRVRANSLIATDCNSFRAARCKHNGRSINLGQAHQSNSDGT